MIRHLLKLVWNRKRTNALIIAEILISFVVVFAVVTAAFSFFAHWSDPLGFEWRGVWDVEMDFDLDASDPDNPVLRDAVRRMIGEAKSFPEVEAVGGSNTPPYGFSATEGRWRINGKDVSLTFDDVTDGFADVMRIRPVRGRWFGPEDDAMPYQAVVIDTNAARALYGDDDPIGKKFDDPSGPHQLATQVVGVVPAYRKNGELGRPMNMVFKRVSLERPVGRLGSHLMVRVRPGTPAEFEARLMQRLERLAPVSMRVRPMERVRRNGMRFTLAPVAIGGIVALFLISMVALGLTGVLWQSVTRRTREIGVRRALGASGSGVHKQILAEVVLLTTLAVIVGALLVLQLPLLGIFGVVPPAAFTTGFLVSLAAIYALTVACGLYPSWLASRLTPADALRYE